MKTIIYFVSFITIGLASLPDTQAQQRVFADINADLTGAVYTAVSWVDYDGDGDLDVLLTGSTENDGTKPISKLYRNDGNDTFVDIEAGFTGAIYASIAWGDYDGDGNIDVLIAGISVPYQGGATPATLETNLYRNNGDGSFTKINASLSPTSTGSVAWGDYDGDGDLDILMAGETSVSPKGYAQWHTKVYRNDGNNTFTDISAELPGGESGRVLYAEWGDYDNDDQLDILVSGDSPSYTKVYRNTGNDSFTEIQAGLNGGVNGGWIDYDGDGDLDISNPKSRLM